MEDEKMITPEEANKFEADVEDVNEEEEKENV